MVHIESDLKETYLGDGLYASVENDMIKLRAPHLVGDHVVYLEDQVQEAFMRYMKEHGIVKFEIL